MTTKFKTILSAVAVSACLMGPALADACAPELKAVDAALLSAKLDAANLKKVQELRALGAKASDEKKPADCLKSLAEAKRLLGVK